MRPFLVVLYVALVVFSIHQLPAFADFVGLPLTALAQQVGISPSLSANLTPRAFVPAIYGGSVCPSTGETYTLIGVNGSYYKNNTLTDENADFRLSILGYVPVNEPLQLISYSGPADPDPPRFPGIFSPERLAAFVATYKRRDWNWDENGPPPYGTPGGANNDWPVSVLDLAAVPGEYIHIPKRNVPNNPLGTVAMVLYVDEDEIAVHYGDQDRVDGGYVVYLLNFCVDPNLVALYRAQLSNGRRATGQLPAIRNGQPVGTANRTYVTVAIRDAAMFMDPRDRSWWPGYAHIAALPAERPKH